MTDAAPVIQHRTPLHDMHLAAGARMTPFAGWEMPVYYRGINAEVDAVRKRAGVFDVSHMGRLELSGPGASDLLQWLTVNDVGRLQDGGGQYSLMLNESGGILDDLTVYRRTTDQFSIVVNASNREKIIGWILKFLSEGDSLEDQTFKTALLAVQGPGTKEALQALGAESLPRRFHFSPMRLAGVDTVVARTGYTGEDGVEVVTSATDYAQLWQGLLARGVTPCGLGARDTLRLEAAYCLYGHEIDESRNPLEAGLAKVVRLDKGAFIGREALLAAQLSGPAQTRIGVVMDERSVPRQGQAVLYRDESVGVITSGTFSPTIGKSIAMAYINTGTAAPGARVEVNAAGKNRGGEVTALPFYHSGSVQ